EAGGFSAISPGMSGLRGGIFGLLNFAGNALVFAHYAEEVSAPDFGDVFFGITAFEKSAGDVGEFAGVVAAPDSAAAVEIRADADVVDSDDFHDVVDVVHDVVEGGEVGRELAVDFGAGAAGFV